MAEEDKLEQPIVIKRIKKGDGHHGGAWKVAYADFVTAMMAFFLLLWLLNVSTDEELNAISSYFDPTHPKVSDRQSGAGGVMGGLSMATEGAMTTTVQPLAQPRPTGNAGQSEGDERIKRLQKAEQARFEETKAAIEKAIEENDELNELKDQLMVDMTPEGLRIQIIDKEGKPMFASGSARMFQKTQALLEEVGEIIKEQPNELSIRGHTDSVAYAPGASYTNWELSADRANSSRRVLLDAGFPAERINNVVGKADTEHLFPDDPRNASNRRVSIILLKEELTNPNYGQPDASMIGDTDVQEPEVEAAPSNGSTVPKIGTFKRTPGAVEFP